ncbi:MAG: NAD(P)/FAD-dependent oxidoreductase [Verrucomicrobia bacterium]|nr:MAG: NAD(P)/FAD-dependent oxidoreductase [Verrucomicrobiota bacterium]
MREPPRRHGVPGCVRYPLLPPEVGYFLAVENYDVAIIGGGPAGSTAATLLSKAGRRVIVLERDKFPRFHIGESLLPFSMETFTRLGIQEKLRAGFVEKFGGEIAEAGGEKAAKFYFKDGFGSRTDRSYQVTRSKFDKMLLDHAAELGAEVREETMVENVDFDQDGATLFLRRDAVLRVLGRAEARPSENIRALYVIDASGRNSVIGNKFKLKKSYQHLQKLSLFAHYEGLEREEGIDGTLTRMVRTLQSWFWIIPLENDRTSIGVVLEAADFKSSGLSAEEFFERAIAEQPLVRNRIGAGRRVSQVYTAADFSYRSERLTGDRWLLAGDAAGFIDPVFSSGVFLAVLAGEQAADVLHEVLDHPKRARRLFRHYERLINRAMDVYLRFVESWYAGKEFIEVFLTPTELLQIPPAVNAVLGGNVGNRFAIRWRMELFYLIVRLQKRWTLCPRLSLVPKTNGQTEPFKPASI